MDPLVLHRDSDGSFPLSYKGIVLSRYHDFKHAVTEAQNLSKKTARNLVVEPTCIASFFVGFKDNSSEIFQSDYYPDSNEFNFIEGPFLTEAEAEDARRKIGS